MNAKVSNCHRITKHGSLAPKGGIKDVDIVALCQNVATRKSPIGLTISDRKGAQSIFSGVCAEIKSRSGMDRTARLDDAMVARIKAALATMWEQQAHKVLTYGRVVSATYDKPSGKLDPEGRAKVTLNAVLKAQRDTKDDGEYRLHASFLHTQAVKRLNYMLEHLSDYTREDMRKQQWVVECWAQASQPKAVNPFSAQEKSGE
jgi:hypothetical protein